MNLEDRLRDELGRAAGGSAEPPNWAAIRDRAFARRRRRRALAYPLVGLVAVTLIVGSVVAVASVRNGDDGGNSVTAGPTNAAPPKELVAVTADGRLVVLETSSGRELRTLADGVTATVGGGEALATSPDGRAVLFTRNATSSTCPGTPDTEIARIDLSTGAIESVVSDAQYPLLSLSPDGRLLAYPPAKSCLDAGRSIVVVDLVTGARTEFTADVGSIINFLSWAPDARHLTYTLFDSPGNFPRVVDTETETRLDEPRAIPTPDESRIRQYLGQTGLFVGTQEPPISDESQGVGVVTFDPTSGAIRRTLFRLPEGGSSRTVASDPTGRHVLATGGVALYRWSEDDTEPTKIADGIIAAAWRPDRAATPEPERVEGDDESAVAIMKDGRVVVLDTETGDELRTLAATAALGESASLAVDPVRETAYFTGSLSQDGCGLLPWIMQVPLGGGATEPVVSGSHPIVSPDGSTLAFSGAPCGDAPVLATRRLEPEEAGASPVPNMRPFAVIELLTWSPDSGRFIYRATQARDAPPALYISAANGGVHADFSNGPWTTATYRSDRNDEFVVAETRDGGFAVVVVDGSSTPIDELFVAAGPSPSVMEFDSAGLTLLYVADGSLFRWTEGDNEPTKIADGILDVAWTG